MLSARVRAVALGLSLGLAAGFAAAQPAAPRPSLLRIVAAEDGGDAATCRVGLYAINGTARPVAVALGGVTWLDERRGARIGGSRDFGPRAVPPGETRRLGEAALEAPCRRLRAELAGVTCGGGACAMPVLGESRGLAGLRVPAALSHGLAEALRDQPRLPLALLAGAAPPPAQAAPPRARPAAAAPAEDPPAEPPADAAEPPVAAPNLRPGWERQLDRVVRGPEGDLVLRYGDIDNLGFGWAEGFDPFEGRATDPHPFPFEPAADDQPGTDRILVGSSVRLPPDGSEGDGYHGEAARPTADPVPMRIPLAPLPAELRQVLVQFFLDDFQAPRFGSRFQVTLNGQRLPQFEAVFNALDQTGPIGKLVSIRLLPEQLPLLAAGTAELRIDDPETGRNDGFALDFVRVLVNPRILHPVTVLARVVDAATQRPIPGASVEAGLSAGTTDREGRARLTGVPAGLVAVGGSHPRYDGATVMEDIAAGETGEVLVALAPRRETASALRQEVERRGRAVLRGIQFDFDRDTPRADSRPALEALLALVREMDGTAWLIEGHTDGVGGAEHNRRLSEARARAVVAWLVARGVPAERLRAAGFGPDRPLADNGTDNGRALNRRVEAVPQR